MEPTSEDVKTAFLHGSIKEEVYLEQPEGFEIHNRESQVCRLKKALYGLKQAPRVWYERIDSYLMKLGFTRSEVDPNLYFKVEDYKPLILVLYVDDLFLTGLEVWQRPGETFLSQGKYVVKILEIFDMVHCKPVTTLIELNFKKAGSVVDRKSIVGCCFSLGSASISWISKKHKLVALSIAEAEYIVASMASCEAVWLRKLFSELFGHTLDTTVILCDTQSGICLSENLVFHDRSKHIDIRHHFIQDMYSEEQ
eukprot:PITA_25987